MVIREEVFQISAVLFRYQLALTDKGFLDPDLFYQLIYPSELSLDHIYPETIFLLQFQKDLNHYFFE
jgi:hypothetical protein